VALQRVNRLLLTRFVPLVSLVAAFAFVVMMFNLPLPGGTTGHAVGVGIAAIVLGPWGAILAMSVALLIQALFFGDGGLTSLGANVFNIAIVGSFVAAGCYRVIAARASLTSRRRVVAAAVAGYVAINAAALCAALELGVQPGLFRDATGAPLYAPYPLRVALPAMMIGHLTIAGLAELALCAGVVAYLQRDDLSLLRLTAPEAPEFDRPGRGRTPWWRPLWIGLVALALLTPLGLVARGSAWGESNGARGAWGWTAPLRGYAAPFVRNPAIGTVVSAVLGVALVVLAVRVLRPVIVRPRAHTAD
jgi:cobalt/nickel transport system permease protein